MPAARRAVGIGRPMLHISAFPKRPGSRLPPDLHPFKATAKAAAGARPDLRPFCLYATQFAVSYVALLFLPLPPLLFKYTAISLTIFPLCVVWITNIKPIRDYLRQHDRGSQAGLPILLWRRITGGHTPSHGSLGRVACTTDDHTRATFHGLGSTSNPHLHETALAAVMEFLPLQQAFGEYCRKALCSEVCTAYESAVQ